MTEKLKLKQG